MSILRQSALLTAGAGHTGHPPVLTVVPAAWLSCATGNGPVLLAGPGPGRAVGYRAAGPGDRDQLRPFPHGRRLPAAPVPVRCRAGLPLLAAPAAGGCGPGGHGRDLPAPG